MFTQLPSLQKNIIVLLFGFIVVLATFLFFGVAPANAAPLDDAKAAACKNVIKKSECLAAVKDCDTQACINTKSAPYKRNLVIRECRNTSDPQKCHQIIKEECDDKPTAAERTRCRQQARTNAVQLLATANTAAGGSGNVGSVSLDSGGPKADTCGSGKNAVKTRFNFGCTGQGSPITDIAYAIIRFLSVGVGLVLIASVIWAGIQYSSAGGNPEATSEAKARIQNAFIGLVFYLLIFAIIQYLVPGGLFR